jgi:hypothetical protein
MRQPDVDARGAVDPGHVVVAIGSIDVDRQRARRRVGLGVLELGRRGPRDQVHQVLIIAVLVQRQVRDILRAQVDADVGLVRLQEDCFGGDGDGFAQRPNLEAAVDADDAAGSDRNAGLDEFLEALQRGFQGVGAAGDVANRVSAFAVGHARQLETGVLVLDRDSHTGNVCTLRIGDVPDESAVKILPVRGRCHDSGDQRKSDGRPAQQTTARPPAYLGLVHVFLLGDETESCGEPGPTPKPVSWKGLSRCRELVNTLRTAMTRMSLTPGSICRHAAMVITAALAAARPDGDTTKTIGDPTAAADPP